MPEPKILRILVLGDVHYGTMATHPDFRTPVDGISGVTESPDGMKFSLIRKLLDCEPSPDIILVPGDLTSEALPSEFIGSMDAIYSIADAINVSRSRVFHTFGNHDTNWSIDRLGDEPSWVGYESALELVASHLGEALLGRPPHVVPGPIPGSGKFENDQFVIFIANSGYFCTSKRKPYHGKLGENQYEWLVDQFRQANGRAWKILMVHHHPLDLPYSVPFWDPSFLEEGSHLLTEASKHGIDLVVHGHRHHPMVLTAFLSIWKNPVNILCAGSLAVDNVHRLDGEIPNVFHIVTLEGRSAGGCAYGSAETFQYRAIQKVWEAADNKELLVDYNQAFGSFSLSDEIDQDWAEIVQRELTNQNRGEVVSLPRYSDLPLRLRCLRRVELNATLENVVKGFGYTVFRRYETRPGDYIDLNAEAFIASVKP